MFIYIIVPLIWVGLGREREPLETATPDRAPEDPPDADLLAV